MIVVRLMGGLGNQMFQYASGLRLATRHQTALKLDLTALLDRAPHPNFPYRDFDLVVFDLDPEIASAAEVERFRRLTSPESRTFLEKLAYKLTRRHYLTSRSCYLETSPAFDARVLELPDNTYLKGFFQNEYYFADIEPEIRQRFRLSPDESRLPDGTRRLADEIRATGGLCVHVRRGDYVSNPATARYHGVCSPGYYQRGLDMLRSQGVESSVFVFSDDPEWCRENFDGGGAFKVVGWEHAGPRASTHLWLMTLCRHFLISNSSFAWWAAWLSDNADKHVVRPAHWFQATEVRDCDICPPAWVSVPNA